SLSRIAASATDWRRLSVVRANSCGFGYYGSSTGVTGTSAAGVEEVHADVERIRGATALPVVVGFGVKTPEQARAIAAGADGVVVGSALVGTIERSLDANGKPTSRTVPEVLDLVRSLASGLRAGVTHPSMAS